MQNRRPDTHRNPGLLTQLRQHQMIHGHLELMLVFDRISRFYVNNKHPHYTLLGIKPHPEHVGTTTERPIGVDEDQIGLQDVAHIAGAKLTQQVKHGFIVNLIDAGHVRDRSPKPSGHRRLKRRPFTHRQGRWRLILHPTAFHHPLKHGGTGILLVEAPAQKAHTSVESLKLRNIGGQKVNGAIGMG